MQLCVLLRRRGKGEGGECKGDTGRKDKEEREYRVTSGCIRVRRVVVEVASTPRCQGLTEEEGMSDR
jgi:hypothetical protein